MTPNERVQVRLDPDTRARLEEVAASRGASISEAVRFLIRDAHQELDSQRRIAAAQRLGKLEIEDVGEPGELKRQLARTHEGYIDSSNYAPVLCEIYEDAPRVRTVGGGRTASEMVSEDRG